MIGDLHDKVVVPGWRLASLEIPIQGTGIAGLQEISKLSLGTNRAPHVKLTVF
jgi:hypothetical protein